MNQEFIEIKGARENNLKDISLKILKREITVFTGLSGSGKSSIVFDTIATEAIKSLNISLVIYQKKREGFHSTIGTITDI